MSSLLGVKLVVSELAMTSKCEVQPWPIRKRRRGYKVVRVYKPGVYRLGDGTMLVHPEVHKRLLQVIAEQHKRMLERAFMGNYG